jgi:GNAT superfamily N-acetyltransferase
MLTIQTATLAHLDAVAALFDQYRQFYGQPADLPLARQFIGDRIRRQESVIFLVRRHETVFGFVQLYPVFSSVSAQRSWLLNDLFVRPDVRQLGFGQRLLQHAQQFVTDRGDKGLALETALNNPAQQLYERLGWQLDRDYRHYFWTAPTIPPASDSVSMAGGLPDDRPC